MNKLGLRVMASFRALFGTPSIPGAFEFLTFFAIANSSSSATNMDGSVSSLSLA